MSEARPPLNAASVAKQLAERLQSRGQEYALGGAIALGYWGDPRLSAWDDLVREIPAEGV